jgi:glucuronoarabinoxylan endo-1,4-beta-xylanase
MRRFLPAVAAAVLMLAGCGGSTSSPPVNPTPSPTPTPSGTATINFATTYQTLRGFGGSTAWMPKMDPAEAATLFDDSAGQIGLTILRVRIDPTSTTGGSNWDAAVANAQEAMGENSEVIVIATPWTPPAAWKDNNSLIMGSLLTANYGAYAGYLESFVQYMAQGGVNLAGISMQNEPDANVTYESCVWTGAQMDDWVANNSSVLTVPLIMPESQGFKTAYSDPALQDPSAVGKIGIIAGHIYGVTTLAPYPAAVNAGKEVWMTEHFLNPAGSAPAIGDALKMAKEIHNSLTVADYNAYVWWWVADWNPGGGVTNTGLVDTQNQPTYFGWAMAQYARFVRPGYVRVDATANPATSVYLSAYQGNGHSVIVAINMGGSAASLAFVIQNQSLTSLVPYQTTATSTVAQQSAVSVANGQFTYSLPAQSITTFVQ